MKGGEEGGMSQEKEKGEKEEKSVNKSEGKRGAIAQRGWALSEATRAAWSANRPPQLSLIKSDFSQLRSQPLHVLPKSPGGHKRMC